MTFLVFAVVLVGLIASGAFLVMFRPSRYFSSLTVNSMGWIAIVFLLYLRNFLLLVFSGAAAYQGSVDLYSLIGVLSGMAVDALIVTRLASYLRFRKSYRTTRTDLQQKEDENV